MLAGCALHRHGNRHVTAPFTVVMPTQPPILSGSGNVWATWCGDWGNVVCLVTALRVEPVNIVH